MADFPYPHGDPEGIKNAAHGVKAAANEFESVLTRVTSAANDLKNHWYGNAGAAWQATHEKYASDLTATAKVQAAAHTILDTFASALQDAQAACSTHHHEYDVAESDYHDELARIDSDGASQLAAEHDPDVRRSAVQAAATKRANAHAAAASKRSGILDKANAQVDSVSAASKTAAQGLRELFPQLSPEPDKTFTNALGSLGVGATAVGAAAIKEAAGELFGTIKALAAGDKAALLNANRGALEALDSIAGHYGGTSREAFDAFIDFESHALGSSVGKLARALSGLDHIPGAGEAGRIPSILGKLGIATGLIADIYAQHDKEATPLDKLLAKVNLGSFAIAASGEGGVAAVADGSAMAALIAANAVDFVPGVGMVVFGTTTVIISAKFIYDNWPAIKHALGATVNKDEQAVVTIGKHVLEFDRNLEHVVVDGVKTSVTGVVHDLTSEPGKILHALGI